MKLSFLAAAAAACALAILPASALAVTPKTVWVAPAPTLISTSDSSCAKPGFNTIQSAINAVGAGSTIHVCPGTYVEQLQITQSVSIVATGTATVQLPSTPANSTTACDTAVGAGPDEQDGIAICGAAVVNITGLTIEAAWPASTCNDSLYGILVGGGATLNLTSSNETAAGAVPLNGCQGGVGIEVGNSVTTPEEVGHANLLGDTISGYQKNGITVDGIGSSASIVGTTVTGIGATTQIAQNGIQISDGAFGSVRGSTITGNECDYVSVCGPNTFTQTQSAGVLLYGPAPGTSITSSTIDGNDLGVYNYETGTSGPRAPGISIDGDTFAGDRYEGVVLDQGWAELSNDSFSGGDIGIDALQYQGQAFAANGTAQLDSIHGESIAAVEVQSDNAPTGDYPGLLSVGFSDLRGNAARLINGSSNYHVILLLDL